MTIRSTFRCDECGEKHIIEHDADVSPGCTKQNTENELGSITLPHTDAKEIPYLFPRLEELPF